VAEQLGDLARTHTCGALRLEDVGADVVLLGWVHRVRDLGGLLFVDVRDRGGITQVVFDKDDEPLMARAKRLRSEFVIGVVGRVRRRSPETINAKLPTGEVEVVVHRLALLNEARTPPFPIADDTPVSEDVRLKYRYLDLRRPGLQANVGLRHRVTMAIRQYFDRNGFWEIETPILTKSTPEGARDYLVPSRVHPGEFYALPQSPQSARRLAGVGSGSGEGRGPARASNELVAYKNVNDVPFVRDLVIQVDQKNEAVLLPIYGSMVPFHVSTVKSVTSHQDNRTCTIRIFFNVPGMPFSNDSKLNSQGAIYLKEITFRSKDPRHSSEVVQQIKTLRRQVASRESERAERATLVTQEKLQIGNNRMKMMKLSDVWIRPAFGGRGRKLTGNLEAHFNGFRYSTSRSDERVDIMYGNIKHAFFQPAEKEMITLLHFHLHNHIMVGNKKTKDVQFYVEVMDVVQTDLILMRLKKSSVRGIGRTE
jgi:hypothetical protein